jgi:hypothetical protein
MIATWIVASVAVISTLAFFAALGGWLAVHAEHQRLRRAMARKP